VLQISNLGAGAELSLKQHLSKFCAFLFQARKTKLVVTLTKSFVISLKRSKPGYCTHLCAVVIVVKQSNQIFRTAVCGGVRFNLKATQMKFKGSLGLIAGVLLLAL